MSLIDNLTESQYDTLRIVAIVGGLALVGGGGYWVGKPMWAHWQSRQALAQSRAFAAKKDTQSMLLALRRATQLAPHDPFVWEETARELGEIGSPEALFAQEELSRLRPGDRAVQLAFAEEALHYGRLDTAKTALEAIGDGSHNDIAYQRVAVRLAAARHDPIDLRLQLDKLIKLEPKNANAQFTLAALNLWGGDAPAVEQARKALDQLLDDPTTRIRAAIQLITEAARHGTLPRVHQVIVRCLTVFAPKAPEAGRSESQNLEALFAGMKQAAPASPTDTALLARWLSDLRRGSDAIAWLQSLPPEVRNAPAVLDQAAQLAAEDKNDPALASALSAKAWGEWPPESWKLAIQYRQQAEQPTTTRHPLLWAAVLKTSADSLEGLRNLARLANAWQRPNEAEAAWLAIIDRAPSLLWVYQALESSYQSRGNLNGLLNLYSRWSAQFPLDDAVAERWTMVSVLLDRVSAASTARLNTIGTEDMPAVVARAAAMWRRGRSWDAEKMLFTLSDADQKSSAGSFWIALAESDLRHREAALDALKIATSFPRGSEEKALLEAAAKKVRSTAQP